jgi:hypothetical protein
LFGAGKPFFVSSFRASCANTWRQRVGAKPTSPHSSPAARIFRREWAEVGKGAVVRDRGDSEYTALDSPDDLLVIAAGGPRVALAR